jgi:hypothetical protein
VLGVVTRTWVDKYREQMRAGMLRYSIAAGLLVVVFVVVVLVQENGSRLLRQII